MKHMYFFKLLIGIFFLSAIKINAQTTGDIIFTGFNADGDKDFSIAILAPIPANSTLYISDKETDGLGGFTTGEGSLTWLTGSNIIPAGSVVTFTDIDNATNPNFGASIGSITRIGGFNLTTTTKDALFIYIGTDVNTPTTFITALQIGNDTTQLGTYNADGISLKGTGLKKGVSIITFDASATPDGAVYKGDKTGQNSFADYYSLIADVENNWTNVVNGNGELLLPFSSDTFSIINATWNGNTDNNWTTATNWNSGNIPTNTSDVLIPNGLNKYPTITNATTVKGITIENGASLIANSNVTGTVIYQRNLTANWHLVSSPVTGETTNNLITNHIFAQGTAGGRIGIAPYKNDGTTWNYQTKSSEENIEKGAGFSVKLATPGNLKFRGKINHLTVNTPVTKNENGYNLIGNPYTSYLNSNTFLTQNSTLLTSQTIWIWNGTNYETKIAADAFILAPAQGFFMDANADGNISFNNTNQQHQTTDTFKRSSRTEIHLSATDNTTNKKSNTKLYYIKGTTTGFDNGYDGAQFKGFISDFSITTQLVSQNKGENYAIQSLPINTMKNTVIPIHLKANAGNEIMFSANSMNLPTNINVYLEDKINGVFTNLSKENYTVILNNNTSQFYLHTSDKNPKINIIQENLNENTQNVAIYASANNTLTITGLPSTNFSENTSKNASIKIYSILGEKIISKQFKTAAINVIQLPKTSKGIYIIELNSNLGKITKKIILN